VDLLTPLYYTATALISATLGALYGLGFRPHLVARLDEYIDATFDRKMNDLVETFEKNPEIIQKLGRPLVKMGIAEISKQLGGDSSGQLKDLKIGGIKIPAWAAQIGLGMLNRQKERIIDVGSQSIEQQLFPKG
jgi:hypothetical protein